jgi:protein-disulfide isomerase
VPGLQGLFGRNPAAGDRRPGQTGAGENRLPQLHALAAGAQGRGWNYLELFYRNQGKENSGYADDEFLTAVAKGAGVKDIAKWQTERKGTKFTAEVTKTTEDAQRFGFTGTPSFAVKGPGSNGIELLGTPGTAEEIEGAIDKAS